MNSEIENDLDGVSIADKYVGGDDNSINITNKLEQCYNPAELLKFSLNAQKYIAKVAIKILDDHDAKLEDQGLDFEALNEKFKNVNCSESYIKRFNEAAPQFTSVDYVRENDVISGGEITIKCIMSLITNIYNHIIQSTKEGDLIHSRILDKLIKEASTTEEYLSADILIFYTINECGIFNERK